ncbi:hypothetical protein [Candidatus Bealeia paramacronuclearis]|uniref:hypothetical protein n=1 Tax=Candidatus Bealeia paramacronuclearis TaxID=1921001 RepID=UPI002F260C2E
MTGTILGSVSSPALLEASGGEGYHKDHRGNNKHSNDQRDYSQKTRSDGKSNSEIKHEKKGYFPENKKSENSLNFQGKKKKGSGASNNSQPSQEKIDLKKIDFTKSLESIRDFNSLFSFLKDNFHNPQSVVKWCNTIRDIIKDKNHRDYKRNINNIFIARVLTSLGQAVKKNPKLKSVLDEYFRAQTEFLDLWEDRAFSFLEQNTFKEQELSNIFYGNAQLGGILGSNFLKKWEEEATNHLKSFNEQELSNIFYGNALLGGKWSDNFLKAWEERALSRLDKFGQQGLSNIFYGNALLGGKWSRDFLAKWETQALSRLNEFKEQELSNIFYGNAQLGGILGSNFLKKWEEEATNHLKSFNEQELSNIFYGNAQLGGKLSSNFLAKWETEALSHVSKFNEQELSNIFYGNAKLGGKLSDKFLANWEIQALSHVSKFNEQELSNIFYGQALLGNPFSQKFVGAWKETFLSKRTNGEFQDPSAEIHSIYLAIQRFNLQKEFAEDLFQEIKLLSKKHGKKNKITTSQLQNSVFESLQSYSKDKDLGDLEEEAFFESVMSPVDIYLKKYGIVVEVQGPSHFLSDHKTAKPEDRLKEHILLNDSEGKVCSVLAIPYFEWNLLKNEQEKFGYFNEKLSPILQTLNLSSPHQETSKGRENFKSSAMNIVLNLGEGKDLNESNLRLAYKKRKFLFSNDGSDKNTMPDAQKTPENKESEINLPFKKRLLPQSSGEIDFSNGAES